MDHKARIDKAKANIETAKTQKTVAETELKAAEQQKAEIVAKMAEYGVTPETIDAEIARLDREIEEKLAEAERLIPSTV